MSENAYLLRLKQLSDQKVESNEQRVAPILGRPLSRNAPGPSNPMMQAPQQEEEAAPDMESMFGKNLESFQGQDKRFGKFMEEYASLAEGLKQEVDNGFMPMPLAKQRLESYLSDSANYFRKNQPGIMDNPEVSAMMEGALARQMEGAGVSPDDQGAPEGAPGQASGQPVEQPEAM